MGDAGFKVGDRVRYFAGQSCHASAWVGRSAVVEKLDLLNRVGSARVRWDNGVADVVFIANLKRIERAVAWCNVYPGNIDHTCLIGFDTEEHARLFSRINKLNPAPIRIEYDLPPAPCAPLKPGDRVGTASGCAGELIAADGDSAWVRWDNIGRSVVPLNGLLPIDKNGSGT